MCRLPHNYVALLVLPAALVCSVAGSDSGSTAATCTVHLYQHNAHPRDEEIMPLLDPCVRAAIRQVQAHVPQALDGCVSVLKPPPSAAEAQPYPSFDTVTLNFSGTVQRTYVSRGACAHETVVPMANGVKPVRLPHTVCFPDRVPAGSAVGEGLYTSRVTLRAHMGAHMGTSLEKDRQQKTEEEKINPNLRLRGNGIFFWSDCGRGWV